MNGKSTCLLSFVVTLSFIAIPARAAGEGQPAGPRKRAVFVPGHQERPRVHRRLQAPGENTQ